ncbi:hypothetical protein Daus18300_003496 [Diaporthe australafricana]|uniref:Transmembrane protein n=1 Tax=Diaporthe australafricana TaxID=127596 RepID=A0ABR3XEV1_9PEZI
MLLTLLFQYVWLTQRVWLVWIMLLVLLVLTILLMLIIALMSRLLVWLQGGMMQWNRPQANLRHRELPSLSANASSSNTSAPINSHLPQDQDQDQEQNHTIPPPSHDNLFGTEDLGTMRARHSLEYSLNAPIPTDSPVEAAYFAGAHACMSMAIATEHETHPYMIVARAAHAISVAASASTSQSYSALLAAVNSVELIAMLAYEEECGHRRPPACEGEQRIMYNVIDSAVRQASAQVPPSKSFIPQHQSTGLVLAKKAFSELFQQNPDLISQLEQIAR